MLAPISHLRGSDAKSAYLISFNLMSNIVLNLRKIYLINGFLNIAIISYWTVDRDLRICGHFNLKFLGEGEIGTWGKKLVIRTVETIASILVL